MYYLCNINNNNNKNITTMTKLFKQIIAIALIAIAIIAVCGADSLEPTTVAIILGGCYLIWKALNLKDVFPPIEDND